MVTVHAKVEIFSTPVSKLPVTKEHLVGVTSVAKLKEPDNAALLVESDPELGLDYQVLDLFEGVEGIKDVGNGGIQTIVRILEAITRHPFVLVVDDEHQIHYRRKDLNEKVLAFEARRK